MKKLLLLSAVIFPLSALAQEPPKVYNLSLGESEIITIAQALGQRPYSEVAGLLSKIQSQVDAQTKKPESPAEAKPEAPEAPKPSEEKK